MTRPPQTDTRPAIEEVPQEELAQALAQAKSLLREGDRAGAAAAAIAAIEKGGIGLLPLSAFYKVLRDADRTEIADNLRRQMLGVMDAAEKDGKALADICMVRLELNDLDGAVRLGRKLYDADPADPENLFRYTLTLLVHGSYDRESIDPSKAFDTAQNPVTLLTGLVSLLAKFDHAEQALALLEECDDLCASDEDRIRVRTRRAGLLDEDPDIDQRVMATAIFDGFAAGYDQKLADLGNNGPQMIGRALALLDLAQDGSRDILDAGCGTGLCAPFLRPYGRHLHGVDLSIPMLERCLEKGTFDLLARTDLATRETFPDATFDMIVCADVLVYFGDLENVFANCFDVLRPGGRFVFTVEEAPTPGPARGHAFTASGRNAHTESYVRSVLAKVGFGPVDLVHRDALRLEFGKPVAGMAIAACRPG